MTITYLHYSHVAYNLIVTSDMQLDDVTSKNSGKLGVNYFLQLDDRVTVGEKQCVIATTALTNVQANVKNMRNKLSLLLGAYYFLFWNILSESKCWKYCREQRTSGQALSSVVWRLGGKKSQGGELLPPRKSPPIRFHRSPTLLRPPPSCSISLGTTFRQKNSGKWRLNGTSVWTSLQRSLGLEKHETAWTGHGTKFRNWTWFKKVGETGHK